VRRLWFQVFPDVTICKTYQLNSLFTASLNWEKYLNDTRDRFLRWPLDRIQSVIPSVTVNSYSAVWNDLLSKDGYYSSLPLDVAQIGHEKTAGESFIIWCYITDWNSVRNSNCITTVQPRWNPMYYRCFTIETRDTVSNMFYFVLL
jgi:hypothetical protein